MGKLEGMWNAVKGGDGRTAAQKDVPGAAATGPGTSNDDKNFTLHCDYTRTCSAQQWLYGAFGKAGGMLLPAPWRKGDVWHGRKEGIAQGDQPEEGRPIPGKIYIERRKAHHLWEKPEGGGEEAPGRTVRDRPWHLCEAGQDNGGFLARDMAEGVPGRHRPGNHGHRE